jgi:hypothetical protein
MTMGRSSFRVGAEEITFGNVLRLFPYAGFVYKNWR